MKWMRIQRANKQEVYSINLEAVIKIRETTDTVKFYYEQNGDPIIFTKKKDTPGVEISEDQFADITDFIATLPTAS